MERLSRSITGSPRVWVALVIVCGSYAAAMAEGQAPGQTSQSTASPSGGWLVRGRPVSVVADQQGTVIAVINVDGERQSASQTGSTLAVPGYGATGEIVPNGLAIVWSSGAVWTRGDADRDRTPSTAGGEWRCEGECLIGTNGGGQVIFVRRYDPYETAGAYQVGSLLHVPRWKNLVGEISGDGQSVTWSDGSKWTR
jgi:hypothetical protein